MRILTLLMLVAVTVTAQTPDENIITQGGTGKVWRHKKVIVVQPGGDYTFTVNADTVLEIKFSPDAPLTIHMTASGGTTPPPAPFTKVDDNVFSFTPSVGAMNVDNASGWTRKDADITPFPSWCQPYYEKSCVYATTNGAKASFTFTGTQIKLHGEKAVNKGRMGVTIMNGSTVVKPEQIIDLYTNTSTNNTQEIYDSGVMAAGPKTITIEVKGPGQGTGSSVQLDAIEYK